MKRKKGVTLIELLVVLCFCILVIPSLIVGIVSLVLYFNNTDIDALTISNPPVFTDG